VALSQARALAGTNPKAEVAFLKKQRALSEEMKNSALLVGTLERWLEIDPTDVSVRFALAYQYGEMDEHALSLYHYSLTPYAERSPITWNNLGAAQNQLGLPAKAVSSYKNAKEGGELFAFSNLAFKYLEVGFLDEARAICDAAPKSTEPNKNIHDALSRIQEVPGEEEKKLEKLNSDARRESEFYVAFGRASTLTLKTPIETLWKGPDFTLTVTLGGVVFSATGDYEVPAGGVLNALVQRRGMGSVPPTKYQIEFEGTAWGSAIVANVSRVRPDAGSLLGSIDSSYNALIYIDDSNGRKMHVKETGRDYSKSYVLTPGP
jgi:tetratricopeptide (TPR) repeat protein